jgi:hypothetical protein
MTPEEHPAKRSQVRREEISEVGRVSRKPYVPPSITRQDLAHVVQGQTGPRLDGISGRIGKSQPNP